MKCGSCADRCASRHHRSGSGSYLGLRKGSAKGSARTRNEARTANFDYTESFYNRPHSALVYKSPLDYESNLS
jgi:hypothetical protein